MLISRPIIHCDRIRILLDTGYLNVLLETTDIRPKIFLDYKSLDNFEIIRTPGDVSSNILRNIPVYEEGYDEAGNLSVIKIKTESSETKTGFGYRMAEIEDFGEHIYSKSTLNGRELQGLKMVFIWATLNLNNPNNLFVTNNEKLLRKRVWFESNFPGVPLGIVEFEEAIEIIDLFLKFHHKYHILNNYTCNKGYWYLLSFRSKIKHFSFGNSTLNALARRFIYLLMSLNEIGFQYYSGVNNDTMDSTLYHFNYFISLVSGVFDSFAIQTNYQYSLWSYALPQRVSLNPRAGKDFLKTIREQHPQLREHIHDYVYFIKLIYELREDIIHRDMLDNATFESVALGGKWKMNFIKIEERLVHLVRQCNDKPQKYDVVTEFGLYQIGTIYFLEPYRFAKSATRMLVKFADKYLEILGYNNFVEERRLEKPKDDFIEEIDLFEKVQFGI